LFPVSRRGGNIPVETMSEPDHRLIAEFNARRSEEAFAALVRQHVNLVFATALRQVGDAGAAEEITQNVFVTLAQAAGKLGSHPTIAGWLHQTALNKSREWLRSELRRRRREQVAVNLDLARAEGDSVWSPLVPLLDEALLELREPDRLAVILHFMEGRTFHEVGSALGIGEDTARKRVNRCLDQLTHFFRRRGFAAPALVAGAPLFALSSHAAPAGLAASATMAGLAAAHSAASTSTLTLIKGALKIMAWTKAKTAIVVGAAVILAASTTTLVVHHQHQDHHQPKPQPVAPTETDFPKSSWTFAGYADPQSALLSALWSLNGGDLEMFLASLTPGERERQQQQLKIGAQRAGKSSAAFFTAASTSGDMPKTKGFRVLDQQDISDDEVILRISIEETGRGNQPKVVVAKMKKTGNEWKVDSIGPQ
jgi:RNA polymerase sigma factor (sigma-70 family)